MNGSNGKPNSPTQLSLSPADSNGHSDGSESPVKVPTANTKVVRTETFDQPVLLQQPAVWSRGIVYGIVGVFLFVVGWASIARIEEAVPATGKLEPVEDVQAVQAPIGGVVREILVEDGERVQEGQVLIRFDPTAAQAQRQSLEQIRRSLLQENAFYRSQLTGAGTEGFAGGQSLPPEMLSLTANRAALISENLLYRAQLQGSTEGLGLSPSQQIRVESGLQESGSAIAAAQLEVAQLQEQLAQTQGQLASARQTLQIDQNILDRIIPLAEEGGIAQVQRLRQEQEVLKGQAEVTRLSQEQDRIRVGIAQARQKLQNTTALSRNDLLNKIAANEQQIANLDSQLNKAIVENEKRISEIDSQLSQARVTLNYQELRAPVDGTVFDLQAKGIGFVANTSEPILKIVPSDGLLAEVYITNKDIGFVREGMTVDVRIDSFPFSEFGDVKGTVLNIGSDALPPDQVHPFYRFPVTIQLDRQYLDVNGQEVTLQSGMSVTANIITRDRTIMSIFTDLFTRQIESLETVR